MYRIEFSRPALKALRRMPRTQALRIRERLDELSRDPGAPHLDVKKLVGRDGYRLRVGDWRVIYSLDQGKLMVIVIAIKPRGEAYR